MPVDSSSTLAEVQAAFDDNALYDVNGSVAQAQAYIAAGRILLRRVPTESGRGSARLRYELKYIADEVRRAMLWLVGNDSSARDDGAMHFDLQDFRD